MLQPAAPTVQVIIPARNEEASIGRCLESLTTQQGIEFQITVVDDGSTDGTRAIAVAFPSVRLITATEPPPGVSGKCNALIQGAQGATAEWLLFTDADTFHRPGSLASSVKKAQTVGADLFSISPQQETVSWSEKMVQPVIFAELGIAYPLSRVNDPDDPAVAANGQYLLAKRSVYESLGGHKVVADKILEDVELARIFKESHHVIWFEKSNNIQTRMYRDFHSLMEGWTKNLVLLFRHPLWAAFLNALFFAWMVYLSAAAVVSLGRGNSWALTNLLTVGVFYLFSTWFLGDKPSYLAFFGFLFVSWLLVRSWLHSRKGTVAWKGRNYAIPGISGQSGSSIKEKLKAKNLHFKHGLPDEKG